MPSKPPLEIRGAKSSTTFKVISLIAALGALAVTGYNFTHPQRSSCDSIVTSLNPSLKSNG